MWSAKEWLYGQIPTSSVKKLHLELIMEILVIHTSFSLHKINDSYSLETMKYNKQNIDTEYFNNPYLFNF